ncbi:hypothetical protein TNCV_1597461 [Trichonephila clavipes]|nr:hypothetical protein TNCV_1597461 [Trichonephila clavipes]
MWLKYSLSVGAQRLLGSSVDVWKALNRRFLLGVWTVNSPQSHIVRVYHAGHGKSGVFHSGRAMESGRRGYVSSSGWKVFEFFGLAES